MKRFARCAHAARVISLAAWFTGTSPPADAAQFLRSDALHLRATIDAGCDAYGGRPASTRHVRLARIHANATPGAWEISSDAAVTKLLQKGTLSADFADVFSRSGQIVYAIYTRGDVTGDGGGASEYCFVRGKLARASALVVDASSDESIERKTYYDARGVLRADTGAIVHDLTKRRNALLPTNPDVKLDVVPYPTPAALPFYAAYRAAVAGRLPTLS